jgi:hypothetical protein
MNAPEEHVLAEGAAMVGDHEGPVYPRSLPRVQPAGSPLSARARRPSAGQIDLVIVKWMSLYDREWPDPDLGRAKCGARGQGWRTGKLYGGAFWIEERRKRCVQSIWVEPEYRHGARHIVSGQPTIVDRSGTHPVDLADLLGKMLRKARVVCALEPMSTAGLRWVKRQGFAIVK